MECDHQKPPDSVKEIQNGRLHAQKETPDHIIVARFSASTDAVSALLIENHSDRVSSNSSPQRHGVRSSKAARLRKRNPKRPTSRSERNPRSHHCG
ncbi:hypothetical protein CDAR_8481 [Caerostris darwini]|uniref:Uncharacterized protein n=1 Tax=Caerostris darwini TaxID=1538125 RepID=A0AAV4RUU3_9ARAC|nr:hypothetical protein CDAR_8481 [Caerostris darwini]